MRGLSVLQRDQRLRDRYVGTVVAGRWSVRERLGGGGEGAVYLATAVDDPARRAALKVRFAATGAPGGPPQVDPVQREHAILLRLEGPWFPRPVEVGTTKDGMTYLVRELIDGPTLHEVVRTTAPMRLNRACQVILRLCDAVLAMHECGYWHRDIKPGNVVLSGPLLRDGSLKLLDYGSAWPSGATAAWGEGQGDPWGPLGADPASGGSDEGRSAHPRAEVAPGSGTAAYMAPELAVPGVIGGEASELYSIAAIAFELFTGQHVLGRAVDSPTAAHEYICGHGPIPRMPLAPLRPDLPAEVAFAVERALRRAPEERGGSIAEFRARLQQTLDPLWADAWDPAARAAPPPPTRWQRFLALIGRGR